MAIPENIDLMTQVSAWDPEQAKNVTLPPGNYPVADRVDDNLGSGLIVVRPSGRQVVVDDADLVPEYEPPVPGAWD